MNIVRDDLPKHVKEFFKKLTNYVDTSLYFYGSVNRDDYIHDNSDIDIAIFTDNEFSTIVKLQHFLHVTQDKFDKVVWKLEGKMIYGYKIKCETCIGIKCEIAIYNNDFKQILLKEFNQYNTIPSHIAILLFILKTLYYTFPIISKKMYSSCKRYLFNEVMLQKKDTIFFLLKQS